jgi:hypothetical protein
MLYISNQLLNLQLNQYLHEYLYIFQELVEYHYEIYLIDHF